MLSLVHWVFARTIAFALHANTHGETERRLLRTLLITCPVCCVLECHVMLSEICQYAVVGTLARHTVVAEKIGIRYAFLDAHCMRIVLAADVWACGVHSLIHTVCL